MIKYSLGIGLAGLVVILACGNQAVTRVIDGDTFMAGGQRVRLYNVDTPERGEVGFEEATDRLRELTSGGVRLVDGPRRFDVYGRRLAFVYTRDGQDIGEMLIAEGLGVPYLDNGE